MVGIMYNAYHKEDTRSALNGSMQRVFAFEAVESVFRAAAKRLRQPNEQRIHARIMAAFRQFTERDWPGLLVVMRDAVQSVHRA